MTTEIVNFETPELLAIEKSKAKQIKETFEPMVKMLENFEQSFNAILLESKEGITKELTSKAKRLRLDVGKVRIDTGKLKDKQKEYIKLEDKAIMGVHNLIVWAVTEKEDKLKEIEDYFETQEKLRLETLQKERVELLSKYVDDAQERRLSDMDEDVWNAYLSTKKKEHEDRVEAEKREKEIEAERKKQAEIIAKQKAESDRLAKIEADKQYKIQAELDAKLKKEQEAKAKLEAELQAKKDAEIKAENDRKQAELKAKSEVEKLAKAPIKHQLNQWVSSFEIPLFTIENDKASEIVSKFEAFKSWAKKEIESI